MQKIIEDYEHKMQIEVTKRWESDNLKELAPHKTVVKLFFIVLTIFTLIDFGFVDLQ